MRVHLPPRNFGQHGREQGVVVLVYKRNRGVFIIGQESGKLIRDVRAGKSSAQESRYADCAVVFGYAAEWKRV